VKLKYLYVDRHNGHEITYHPFTSNSLINQSQVTELLSKIPGASRCGTRVYHLLDELDKKNIAFDTYTCGCCGNKVPQIINPVLSDWTTLEGITGNY